MATSSPSSCTNQPTIRVTPEDEVEKTSTNSVASPGTSRSKSSERSTASSTTPRRPSACHIPQKDDKKRKKSSQNQDEIQQHSMLAKLTPSLHMRRKSSPAIPTDLSGLSARKNHHRSKLFATPSSSQLASRRLSSPPSLDKSGEEFFSDKIRKSRRQRNNGVDDCDIDGGGGSGSSNGSLNKLCISGLNPSSSDLHQIISGHQNIGTLYAPNSKTYHPESISINMLNAPGDSTVQCDCGHINCPLCNLMMNLELTDPNQLM